MRLHPRDFDHRGRGPRRLARVGVRVGGRRSGAVDGLGHHPAAETADRDAMLNHARVLTSVLDLILPDIQDLHYIIEHIPSFAHEFAIVRRILKVFEKSLN